MQKHTALGADVRIRQVDGEQHVIAPDGGAEQQRTAAQEFQLQTRQKTRAPAEYTLLRPLFSVYIAVFIENPKGIVLFQNTRQFWGRRGLGLNIILAVVL